MKKIKLKKGAVVLTMVAALGLAVYLNYYFADGVKVNTDTENKGNLGEAIFVEKENEESAGDESVAVDTKVNYFAQARKNRETARDEAIDMIKDIAADIKTNAEAAKTAADKITALTEAVVRESKIEDIIKAKGFEDCVVYIADDNCTVVVKGKDLTPAQSLQITEIVTAQSKISAQKINIMAVNS